MATLSNDSAAQNTARDNDYFTSTIVGLPYEVTLGKAFTARKLTAAPTITVQAMTAATWLSEPARQLLKQQIKQSPKTLGLPFAAGSYAHTRSKYASFWSSLWAFVLGFSLCAALSYIFFTQPWLQQLLRF
jgi:hypothetical protein